MATQTPANPTYGPALSPLRGEPAMGNVPTPFIVETDLGAVGASTLTAAALLGGLITHAASGSVNDTTDTAANIINAIQGASVGQGFYFDILNKAGTTNTITVVGGTGVTINGTATIAQNNGKRFLLTITALANLSGTTAAAVAIQSLGTYVF